MGQAQGLQTLVKNFPYRDFLGHFGSSFFLSISLAF